MRRTCWVQLSVVAGVWLGAATLALDVDVFAHPQADLDNAGATIDAWTDALDAGHPPFPLLAGSSVPPPAPLILPTASPAVVERPPQRIMARRIQVVRATHPRAPPKSVARPCGAFHHCSSTIRES